MKFEDYKISPKIKSQLKELGYNKPTDIQFKAIDPILKGEDVLAIAQTGTGKTAAFVIPILQKLDQQHVNNKQRVEGVKCLVLAPTRELAIQISKVFQAIGEKLPVVSACIHGGWNKIRKSRN